MTMLVFLHVLFVFLHALLVFLHALLVFLHVLLVFIYSVGFGLNCTGGVLDFRGAHRYTNRPSERRLNHHYSLTLMNDSSLSLVYMCECQCFFERSIE